MSILVVCLRTKGHLNFNEIIFYLTAERNSLWRPRAVGAADPPGWAEQLEAPVAVVARHGARAPLALARAARRGALSVELDLRVRGRAGEAAET